MGFMDKAKKLADQAQAKLDEVQKQFNDGQGASPQQSSGAAVEYDQHGRPVATPAQAASPVATPPQGDPAGDVPPPPAADTTPHVAPQPKPHGDPLAGDAPKPPQPPSGGGMTSGDPLAG